MRSLCVCVCVCVCVHACACVIQMKYVRVGRLNRRVRVEGRNSNDWMAVDLGK